MSRVITFEDPLYDDPQELSGEITIIDNFVKVENDSTTLIPFNRIYKIEQ